jgi:hypothetical protein
MSRDDHPQLRDVTAYTEDTASSIVDCCTVFTELLPGNALIKSVRVYCNTSVILYFPLTCSVGEWYEHFVK